MCKLIGRLADREWTSNSLVQKLTFIHSSKTCVVKTGIFQAFQTQCPYFAQIGHWNTPLQVCTLVITIKSSQPKTWYIWVFIDVFHIFRILFDNFIDIFSDDCAKAENIADKLVFVFRSETKSLLLMLLQNNTHTV